MADRKSFDPSKPHAFLSYTRADDEYLDGGITWLRGALERAVRARTGSPFQIFQDVEDIEHGENWERKLNQVLESAQLFIPILTPSFFTSEFCRREAISFLDYEGMAKRGDLILPIYLIDAEILDDPEKRAGDDLAARLLERQHDDWRELRFELRDPATRPRIERLADTLARAAKRRVKASVKAPKSTPTAPKPKADVTDRLAALEAKLAERDQAIEAERSKAEQLTFALTDKDTKLRELAEAQPAFEGQVEEARKQEGALRGEIRQLKERLAERDGKSVKQRLAGMEAALEEEEAKLKRIKGYPLGMPPMMLIATAALMAGVGGWWAWPGDSSPTEIERLRLQNQELIRQQEINAAQSEEAQRAIEELRAAAAAGETGDRTAELTERVEALSAQLAESQQSLAEKEGQLFEAEQTLVETQLAIENQESAPRAGESFKDCEECPEMVVIPAGTFLMGSPEAEGGRFDVEGPQHEVTIAEPFALGKYEVTFDQWDACVAAGGCDHEPDDRGWGRGDQPVINVSWNDARQYCGWLSETTGKTYRLPSEAEWEYAARAGTETVYAWGDEIGANRANCDGCGSQWDDKQTAPVGSFEPNPFGLADMHGNVWEWVEDRWYGDYEGAPDDGTPRLEGESLRRVVRGGSWLDFARRVRSAVRVTGGPGYRIGLLGFRCAGVQA